MNKKDDLLLIVTYAIIFLLIFLISIIIFIVKSRKDRISIQNQKKEIEEIVIQKTVLLKEIHHRVKNNLQLISGLLYLQSVKHENAEITAMVNESQKHINSIAMVHEMLYQEKTVSLVSMKKYLKELGAKLLQISSIKNIDYKINVADISLTLDYATTLGLIFNELVTNSFKYAFNTNKKGVISVSLEEVALNEYRFMYSDNGKGFDVNASITRKTMGQKLIKMFVEEIGARLEILNDNGLTYILTFKNSYKIKDENN
ncbi:putative sensor histidine kinase pdtaS [Polaribacter huanghezhanensis]|uniref:sensor histidine kinase n=1 Tax=Polaribacter huanghezhanensis TaxID=1354726 RepID=UPI002648C657|nr:sensor histidine kinase [Polaribacter huanghezhanensis]WKD85109.1 putative sensor histidine kinase pdtaS [Polaribacter huanghezhanensis]